jgi:hypothetical protein
LHKDIVVATVRTPSEGGRRHTETATFGTTARQVALLADLAKGKMRVKIPTLREALDGRFDDHHATVVRQLLDHVDALDVGIAASDARVAQAAAPWADLAELLCTIPPGSGPAPPRCSTRPSGRCATTSSSRSGTSPASASPSRPVCLQGHGVERTAPSVRGWL